MAVLNYLVCGSFDAMRQVDWRLQAGIWGTVLLTLLTLLSACVSGPCLHGVLALGAALVGGDLLCVVQLSLQYARELAPQHTRYLAGCSPPAMRWGSWSGRCCRLHPQR
ncbi:hypothetical protein BBW68_05340 [Candidatus Erwinia dacicola]|uniref:Major facilitator family transporter n=1 Tax=Candidatus Erwinia dacicola TaxID=252393 RepID=A0A1E7Z4B1_9GAMM|nr:hypothetical protein BBW68_05340 [Candidatus Erwinia dacicola]RAP71977.1 major facilitator family transporter [Candidatus Erwinia dacicola]